MLVAIVAEMKVPQQDRQTATQRAIAAIEAVRAANALTPELKRALADLEASTGRAP